MKNLIKTNEKIEVKNYPYGFKLRTTLFDYVEFSPKKGYRHCTQTVNPKNGRLNNPKKSTYYPLLVRYYNEKNHIKSISFDFNGDAAINKGCEFLGNNFELFTPEEIKYLYSYIFDMSFIDFKATCIYGGSKAEELKPLYKKFWEITKQGLKEGTNLFAFLKLDSEAINATKPENFSPFVVKSYSI